ncbi:sterol desaturase/sphingolipid hydroxylase (fatty acid hydroxylase superfamily) [Lutibacter sp. Hel_I_33_5]|uniref:sterol desaturase family protein n=1 Tax=Lutibacter sp. Hel_I_33_5 TaxID=1566289 RepID=UPI0011A1C722|nr:sterol desaturase family protein [Lutibacter sp. Hel_I_33_5]TVZ55099.1 sterol desaturase/sphingolipid hydroxylase (fatty acid hydroxylase superfamily) [Lutibacter sp. Hel_I_33_5]
METYANALLYAIPYFSVLVLIEVAYGYFVKNQTYTALDTIASLSSGVTNSIKDSLGLVVILISYPFLVDKIALLTIESTWLVYVIAFIAIDFAGYWSHRLNHHVNYFWNLHVIHHSSEEFNLACALRQSISNFFGYIALFLLPAALLGVPYKVIGLLLPIHLFAQFWYHTKHIGKLGFLEYIIVTPSQHRVHHAINDIYLDKNLSPIFCVWDRIFGTFQEELDEVPVVFGVLKPARTWNPILINFQHLWQLIKDAWRTNNWIDKLRIWFMPTGWRPSDVIDKYPVKIIEDPYGYEKYTSNPSKALIFTSYIHFIITQALLLFMFYNYVHIGASNLLIYGFLLFLGVYSFTSLMDYSKHSLIFELLRTVLGVYIIYTTADWFGLNEYLSIGSTLIIGYFLVSLVASIYFLYFEKRTIEKELAVG